MIRFEKQILVPEGMFFLKCLEASVMLDHQQAVQSYKEASITISSMKYYILDKIFKYSRSVTTFESLGQANGLGQKYSAIKLPN
ncbi:mCG147576 [Mus musculus]|nr:mCG147576 [Mus musculus]